MPTNHRARRCARVRLVEVFRVVTPARRSPAALAAMRASARSATAAARADARARADRPSPARVASMRELVDRYDVFLLDQFGVLHDGRAPYAGAARAVRELRARGKSLYVLSNSSRGREGTIEKLAGMGFDADAFAGATTSGHVAAAFLSRDGRATSSEARFERLASMIDRIAATRRVRVAHATWSARGNVTLGAAFGERFEVAAVENARDVDRCDFVLAHGVEAFGRGDGEREMPVSEAEMRAMIERAAALKLPLCVANPDVVTVSGKELVPMPGTLAKWYAEAFARAHDDESASDYVCLMGKPDGIVYETLLGEIRATRPDLDTSRVLAVGDSLAHDIAGGANAGLDTAFVCMGIHADEVVRARTASDGVDALDELFREHGARPTYVMDYLTWTSE